MDSSPPWSRGTLVQRLTAHGLRLRGGFVPGPQDGLPPLPGGQAVAVVWLVAHAGSEMWPRFSSSEQARDGLPDPLDRWSRSIGDALADELGGRGLYPSEGPPYYPFQRWAARIEALPSSPLLLQMHPEFGLWHAYRFALALPRLGEEDLVGIRRQASAVVADVCLQCEEQPCLRACPVDAFGDEGYAVQPCRTHLAGSAGAACRSQGCLARRACPAAVGFQYAPAHAEFHMEAFLRW